MTTVHPQPKPLDQVDPVILGHVIDALHGCGEARTILSIAEDVAKRMGGELPTAARLYPAHPSRLAVCECVAALYWAGELEALMAVGPVIPEGRAVASLESSESAGTRRPIPPPA